MSGTLQDAIDKLLDQADRLDERKNFILYKIDKLKAEQRSKKIDEACRRIGIAIARELTILEDAGVPSPTSINVEMLEVTPTGETTTAHVVSNVTMEY